MADVNFDDLDAAVSIDGSADYWPINQGADTNRINRNTLLGVTGTPADISTAQNFTNKTLDNTNILTLRDDRFTLQDNGNTTRQVQFNLADISTSTTRTFRFPDVSDILVTESATQGMTNKTLTSPTINGGTIANATITVNSIAEYTAANGVTIDGLNIKDGKLNTNNSVVTANIPDAAVTPAKLIAGTGSSWAWQTWTPTLANITAGNGTTVAIYTQIGKTVIAKFKFTLGNTSSMGTAPTFTLPVTASANWVVNDTVGFGTANDTGSGSPLDVIIDSTTVARPLAVTAGGTYASWANITSAIPFSWGTGDFIQCTIIYEAA